MPRLTNQIPDSQVNNRYYFKSWSGRHTHWVLLPDRWLWWVSMDQFRAPSFQPDWSPFYFAHIATKSQSDACSFIQPDAGWIQIPLRHSREAQKVTVFSGNDHHYPFFTTGWAVPLYASWMNPVWICHSLCHVSSFCAVETNMAMHSWYRCF